MGRPPFPIRNFVMGGPEFRRGLPRSRSKTRTMHLLAAIGLVILTGFGWMGRLMPSLYLSGSRRSAVCSRDWSSTVRPSLGAADFCLARYSAAPPATSGAEKLGPDTLPNCPSRIHRAGTGQRPRRSWRTTRTCHPGPRGMTTVASEGNESVDAASRIPASYSEVVTVSSFADSDGLPGGLGGAPRLWAN